MKESGQGYLEVEGGPYSRPAPKDMRMVRRGMPPGTHRQAPPPLPVHSERHSVYLTCTSSWQTFILFLVSLLFHRPFAFLHLSLSLLSRCVRLSTSYTHKHIYTIDSLLYSFVSSSLWASARLLPSLSPLLYYYYVSL